jgi:hypothetical protein
MRRHTGEVRTRVGPTRVLLTPIDMLTRDDTWISHNDMLGRFSEIPAPLPNDQLRAQVSNYFARHLSANPTQEQRTAAVVATIREYPELIDYYIRLREQAGDQAESLSLEKVQDTLAVFVDQLKRVVDDLKTNTDFYRLGWSSYEEALARVQGFKQYVENQDGWQLISRAGEPFAKEKEVQLFSGLIWFGKCLRRQPGAEQRPWACRLQDQHRCGRQVPDRVQACQQQPPEAEPGEPGRDLRASQSDRDLGHGDHLLHGGRSGQGDDAPQGSRADRA